jgi:preprotein translocase subunit Sec61beta
MAKGGKKGQGFHSGAGLIRYFDQEDETSIKVNPWIVVSICIACAVIIEFLRWYYPVA